MTEGATIFMRNFTVGNNGTVQGHKFMPTAHKYKMVFSPTTIVRPIQDFTGSRHSFNFTSFTDIATNDEIKDQHCVVQIKLTLFGKFIELLTEEVSKQDPNRPVVIILQFGKINEYRNVKGVANAFNGSKLFVNNDIDEINAFLERYDGSGQVERLESGTNKSTINNPTDFFKDCGHVSLADYMTHEQDGCYVTYATIDSIDADEPWWYSACNATKRFKVCIRVINDTGSSSFTLFDNHIKMLIGMSAHNLRKKYLDDPDIIPEELTEIVGKSYLFKFQISDYNRREDYHCYSVNSLTDDNPTIAAFKKAFNMDTDTLSVTADSQTSLKSPHEKLPTTDSDNDPEFVECSMNKKRRTLRCTNLEDD